MRRFVVLFLLLMPGFFSVVQAQTPAAAPKPDPALKKLSVLVGHWTYEEEWKAGPLGPGGKMTGVYDAHMILGGFFLQAEQTEKGAMGEIRNLEIDAYDPVNRNFTSDTFLSDGTKSSFTITVSGNTITWAGTLTFAGKQYQFKEPMVFAPDFMSATAKAEVSVDGKTWIPCPSPKLRTKAILIHVTCYTASLYVIDFTRALNSGEAHPELASLANRFSVCLFNAVRP